MTHRFRVWDTGGEMHHPPHQFYLSSEGVVCWHSHETLEHDSVGIYTPQFYTGLDDAEGTPIYESDVVEFWEHDLSVLPDDEPEGHSRIAAVKYLDGHWWMDFTDPGKGFLSDISYKDHTVRVIGDCFQTPELLD